LARLAQVSGIKSSGFASAIDDAVEQYGGAVNGCKQPLVLLPTAPKSVAMAHSLASLGLTHALAHGLPLLTLACWALWRLDRRTVRVIRSDRESFHY